MQLIQYRFKFFIFLAQKKKMETLDLVIKALETNDKPMRPGEIAEKAGIEKADVDKAIKQLKKEERIYSPKRCFYDVKK